MIYNVQTFKRSTNSLKEKEVIIILYFFGNSTIHTMNDSQNNSYILSALKIQHSYIIKVA